KHYRAVLLGISSFGLRNAAALTAGLLPVAALFLLLAGLDPSGSAATELEVHPPELELAPGAWTLRDGRMRASRSDIVPKGITLAGGAELRSDRLAKKLALCASSPACVLFDMMLFETQHAPGLERS